MKKIYFLALSLLLPCAVTAMKKEQKMDKVCLAVEVTKDLVILSWLCGLASYGLSKRNRDPYLYWARKGTPSQDDIKKLQYLMENNQAVLQAIDDLRQIENKDRLTKKLIYIDRPAGWLPPSILTRSIKQ